MKSTLPVEPRARRLFRFDGAEVDSAQPGVRRAGAFFDLRQRAFQVLVYLLDHRDRMVSREELMEALWKETSVTEGALNQCIVDIRRALDDDPRTPRYVKTIPKSGYQFIAPAEEVSAGALTTRSRSVEITTLEVEIEEDGRDVPAPLRALPPAPRRRVVEAGLGALLMAAAFGIVFAWRQRLPDMRLPATPGKTTVAVLFFENRAGSRELDWLREGLADMLITDLSRSRKLSILSRQQLHVLLDRLDRKPEVPVDLATALELGRRSGASALVLGSFHQIGPRVRLDAQLHDARTGGLLSAETLVAEQPEQLLTQVGLLATRLADRLGAPLVTDDSRVPAGSATDNLDAYRYYSLSLEKSPALHNAEAIGLLEKAIALDPDFAMAHARIGYALGVSDVWVDEALPHLVKAASLTSRLTPTDRLHVAAWTAIVRRDFPAAIETYRKLIREHPRDVDSYKQLGHLLQGEERLEESVRVLQDGLVVDPDAKHLHNMLSGVYSELSRHAEAVGSAERYVALDAKEPNAYDSLGLALSGAGRHDEALAAYDRALALDPDFLIALIHQANTRADLGQYRAARAAYHRVLDVTDDAAFMRARAWDAIALIELKRGDLAGAEKAVANLDDKRWTSNWLLALAKKDLPRIRSLAPAMIEFLEVSTRGMRNALLMRHLAAGRIAIAGGDVERGLVELREATRYRPLRYQIETLETCLADALLELGRLEEATAEYDRLLKRNPGLPMALYRSGLALDRLGRREDAAARLGRFLELWKDADEDAPERIDAMRRLRQRS